MRGSDVLRAMSEAVSSIEDDLEGHMDAAKEYSNWAGNVEYARDLETIVHQARLLSLSLRGLSAKMEGK